ncbi:MAG: hypothetical protein Q8Q95_02325 [bacterium]|nr:hypothetical protein [bacterium]
MQNHKTLLKEGFMVADGSSRGGQAKIVVAVIVPVVVDVEAVLIEVADANAVAIGVKILLVSIQYHRKV